MPIDPSFLRHELMSGLINAVLLLNSMCAWTLGGVGQAAPSGSSSHRREWKAARYGYGKLLAHVHIFLTTLLLLCNYSSACLTSIIK